MNNLQRYLLFESGATRKKTISVSLLIVNILSYFKLENPRDLAHDYFSSFYSLLVGCFYKGKEKCGNYRCFIRFLLIVLYARQ